MAKTNATARPATKPAGDSTPARRGLKPRERTFRYGQHSRSNTGVPRGDKTIKRNGPQVQIVRPVWKGKPPTIFRPLPALCPDDQTTFDPARLSSDPSDFSDWVRGYPCVRYVGLGDNKISFILYDPRLEMNNEYDRQSNPYLILFNAIDDAVENGEAIVNGKDLISPKWAPLVKRDSKKRSFNPPSKQYFMQGLLYEHNGVVFVKGGKPPKGAGEEDLPQIIEVTKTGGEHLEKLLNALNEDYTGDENDPDHYLYGDPTDLVNGKFLILYNPDEHNIEELGVDPADIVAAEGEEEESGGKGDGEESREFKGWKAAFVDEYKYVSDRKRFTARRDLTKWEAKIRSNLVWWDDLIHIPEHEEICLWLAGAFRAMPNLLRFGWADNREFFTDEVKGILAARTQGAVPEVPADGEPEQASPRRRSSAALPQEDADPIEDADAPEDAEDAGYEDADPEVVDDDADVDPEDGDVELDDGDPEDDDPEEGDPEEGDPEEGDPEEGDPDVDDNTDVDEEERKAEAAYKLAQQRAAARRKADAGKKPATKPAAAKPATTKPAAAKPAAAKPATGKKPATKPAATKPATKPANGKKPTGKKPGSKK